MSGMIYIPFNEWSKERIKAGVKTATSRYKKYGEAGDRFVVDGEIFELVEVVKMKLGIVAELHYEEEGAKSPEEFKKIWIDIHPKRGFRADDMVWFHRFRKVEIADFTNFINFTYKGGMNSG